MDRCDEGSIFHNYSKAVKITQNFQTWKSLGGGLPMLIKAINDIFICVTCYTVKDLPKKKY
jgi:hypothetical protein